MLSEKGTTLITLLGAEAFLWLRAEIEIDYQENEEKLSHLSFLMSLYSLKGILSMLHN